MNIAEMSKHIAKLIVQYYKEKTGMNVVHVWLGGSLAREGEDAPAKLNKDEDWDFYISFGDVSYDFVERYSVRDLDILSWIAQGTISVCVIPNGECLNLIQKNNPKLREIKYEGF